MYPMVGPSIYAKVMFNAIKGEMKILPGDQVSVRFASDITPNVGLRLKPNIESEDLPSPMKEKYQ